jgi:hypothetical protein
MPTFVRFERRTHLVSPLGGGEHTLCGVAFDACDSEGMPSLSWKPASSTVVTCPDCGRVIQECRWVEVRKPLA